MNLHESDVHECLCLKLVSLHRQQGLSCGMQGTGGMKKGQTVLITAAAGATGHIGVQLAVLAGCTVIATCGGPKKSAALKKLGVQHIIDYKSEVILPMLWH